MSVRPLLLIGLVALSFGQLAHRAEAQVHIRVRTSLVNPVVYGRNPDTSPINYVPFNQNVDPATGKPADSSAPVHLPNGRTITVQQYWDQMNQVEAMANKQGYSIKSFNTVTINTTITKETIAARMAAIHLDRATLQSQRLFARQAVANGLAFGRRYDSHLLPNVVSPMLTSLPSAELKGPLIGAAQIHSIWMPTAGAVNGSVVVEESRQRIVRENRLMLRPGAERPRAVVPRVNQAGGSTLTYINISPPAASALGLATPTAAPSIATSLQVEEGQGKTGPDNSYFDFAASAACTWSDIFFEVPNPEFTNYVYQVVDTDANPNGFASNGWQNWQNPAGQVATGMWNLDPSQPQGYGQIEFGAFEPVPQGTPDTFHHYQVRVVPVDLAGAIAGLPSDPVTITYGNDPTVVNNTPPPPPPSYAVPSNGVQQWNKVWGDASIMAGYLNGSLSQQGDTFSRHDSLSFATGVSLLGLDIDIITASASADATLPQPGDTTTPPAADAALSVTVLGKEVYPGASASVSGYNQVITIGSGDIVDVPLDVPFQAGIPVGPLDVSIAVSLSGDLGVGADVIAHSSSYGGEQEPFGFTFTPHANISGSATGAIGIGIDGFDVVSVGAGVDVNIINLDTSFTIGASGNYAASITNLTVLSGDMTAFAKIGYCPFCAEFDVDICHWPGWDLTGGNSNMVLFQGNI